MGPIALIGDSGFTAFCRTALVEARQQHSATRFGVLAMAGAGVALCGIRTKARRMVAMRAAVAAASKVANLWHAELMIHFNARPLLTVIGILAVEIYIGICVRDAWVRPYGGDLLAVIFVYTSLRVLLALPASALAMISFLVGAAVEVVQYLGIPASLGLSRHPLLAVVVGTTFQWGDLLAYALGAFIAWMIDTKTQWWTRRP